MKTPIVEADLSELNLSGSTFSRGSSKKTSLKESNLELNLSDCENTPEETLSRHIRQAIEQLAAGDFHDRWDAAKQFTAQFQEWGDRVVPTLIEQLQHQKDPEVQWFLVRILSQFEHPLTVAALADLLAHADNEELQQAVSKALSGMGAIAIETLTDLLHHKASATGEIDSTERRLLAARTLAHIRRGAVIEPLLGVVDDADAQLRAIAIEALASFHDPRVTPVLLNALNDQPSICMEAVRTLGRRRDLLPTTDLVGPLQQCLLSQDEAIARESATALGRLGNEAAVAALGEQLDQPLKTAVRCAIAESLGWLNLPAAVTYLAISFQRSEPFITTKLKQAIAKALGQTRHAELKRQAAQPMIAWLNTEAPHTATDLAQSVLLSLARLGVPDAVSSIVPMLGHSDSRLRMHALNALKQIDPRTSQQFTQQYLKRTDISAATKQSVEETLAAW